MVASAFGEPCPVACLNAQQKYCYITMLKEDFLFWR